MFIFELSGDPKPQKQTQFSRHHSWDPSAKVKSFIQWQAKYYAPENPLLCPIQMDLTFYFKVPKSTSGTKRRQMLNHVIHHIKRPDIDNCAYLVTNALKKIFYEDDSQIIDLYLHKRYGETPKTVVKITPIEELVKTQGDQCG